MQSHPELTIDQKIQVVLSTLDLIKSYLSSCLHQSPPEFAAARIIEGALDNIRIHANIIQAMKPKYGEAPVFMKAWFDVITEQQSLLTGDDADLKTEIDDLGRAINIVIDAL